MNYIDFFSGSGGLSIGLESEGLELVYSNDLNKHATDTFKRNLTFIGSDKTKVINLPIELLHKQLIKQKIKKDYQGKVHMNNRTKKIYDSYKNYSAVDVNFDKYKKENLGNIDMIVGGPPCQGFSTAARGGKSKIKITKTDFIDDPRNQLFKFFLDFVDYYNPKIVLIENVPGLTTAPNYLKIIESTLSKCANGYFTSSHILDSSYFGVPQKRERVFIMGIRKDINEAESLIWNLPTLMIGNTNKISLKDAIGDLPIIRSNPKKMNSKEENEIPIGEIDSFGQNISKKKYESYISSMGDYVKRINTFRGKVITPKKLYNHKARFNNKEDLIIYKKIIAGKRLQHPDNSEVKKLVKYSTNSFSDKYHKLDPNQPSRTIVAHLKNDNNGYIHYGKIPRGITPREAARIQSFPDWFFFEGPLTMQYEQIGNAVPPLIGRFFGKLFKTFLEEGLDTTIENINEFHRQK